MRPLEKKVALVIGVLLTLYLIMYYAFRVPLSRRKVTKEHAVRLGDERPGAPKILIWAKQYHKIGYTFPKLPNGDGGCRVTWDREEYEQSDAVVFYMKSCSSRDLPDPKLRRANQTFVWWSHESPWTVRHYYYHDLKDFNHYFNWTMTYRSDSDVLASFGPAPALDYFLYKFGRTNEIVDKDLPTRKPMSHVEWERQVEKLMSKKTKFIAWIASDCDFTSGARKRLEKVKALSNLLDFDKFGNCGTMKLPLNYTTLMQTMAPYKFYFAFENSFHCQDYITEKFFFNGMVATAVPVVMGPARKDVEIIFPPDSFIHVDDFKNYSSFAAFLKYLDINDTAYKAYFSWWKRPEAQSWPRYGYNYGTGATPETGPGAGWSWNLAIEDNEIEFERFGLYHLCRKLKNREHVTTSKSIPDLNDLWYTREPPECTDG